jgi:PAS domain-containing protein
LRRDGQDDGHLVGVVRLGELLDRLLAGQVEAASIVLRFEGREVYPHATGAAAPEQADPALRLQLPVFEGDPRWQLVAVLHAAKGSRDSVLPELVLATALALAALLQGAVLLGWSSHQRALALQEARDRLDEAAERVRLATAGARVGIWDWRVDSASLNCDAQTREHLGGASPPTAGGLAALRERVQDPAALAAFIAALERGDNDVTAVLPVRHQDGTELELQFDGHAVRNEAGESPASASTSPNAVGWSACSANLSPPSATSCARRSLPSMAPCRCWRPASSARCARRPTPWCTTPTRTGCASPP